MLVLMLGLILSSMSLVREREQGTLEQLIVTPLRPLELIMGKILPFIVLLPVAATFQFLAILLIFEIPFREA